MRARTALAGVPDMMRLDEAGRRAMLLILCAPRAWSEWDAVERSAGKATMAALLGQGVIEPWQHPHYLAVTLTPLGASRAHAVVEEWGRYDADAGDEGEGEGDGPGARPHVPSDMPRWLNAPKAEADGQRRNGHRRPAPRCPGTRATVQLLYPERVPDHRPGPLEELLLDEFSSEPILLFAGGGAGIPVKRDRRLKPGRAQAN